MRDIKKIGQIISKKHGGFQDATDAEIITLWESLPAETRKRYLDEVKGDKNADSIKSK